MSKNSHDADRYTEQGLIAGFLLGLIIVSIDTSGLAIRWFKYIFLTPGLIAAIGLAMHTSASKKEVTSRSHRILSSREIYRTCITILAAAISAGIFVICANIIK